MQQQVLLIDDAKTIHPLVTSLLAEEPININSAFDGESGLVLAASLRPDLILLDVEMPGMDGYETCQRLKNDPATASLPVIFLTAQADTDNMVHGLNLGATDYVAKPFKLSELQSRVRAALRTSHLIRLLEEKALIDSLTGVGNRAMFDDRFAAEVALRIRSGNPLTVIAMDVDDFAGLNNKYGQAFAGYVLSKIGRALMDVARVEDVVCRHTADRFVILAPLTTSHDAGLLAEKMRLAVAKIPFTRKGEPVAVTCSFGIAEAGELYDRLMLERADDVLYQSKQKGRNRVAIAASLAPAQLIAA